ncbi:MAG: type II toxin-antitoxin system RelE/ParE family toxin [Oscillospiraceae bacterium]|nr:type II toxin-antitoxin system RelE/ParE family toxin [Oscillospiraceae bacterium]
MKYRIEYISTFHSDLASVVEFLEEYPNKASRIISKLDKSLAKLREMPEMYPVYPYALSYRFIVVEDYLVFYKLKKLEEVVEIHRLLPGSMDIPARLQE